MKASACLGLSHPSVVDLYINITQVDNLFDNLELQTQTLARELEYASEKNIQVVFFFL